MKVLFLNAAFRNGSRTLTLAKRVLNEYKNDEVEEIDLGSRSPLPLNTSRLQVYDQSVAAGVFDDDMFDIGKKFAAANEIVIAAPFWNYTLPAVLHDCLEMICSQGVTFDIGENGVYSSLCKAKKLTFITTAGGFIPENDHAFSYIRDLAEVFWDIKEIRYIKADGLDIVGTDIEKKLLEAYR